MKQPLSYTARLAVRGLVRSRGTTLIAMLTLAVGLAAAVALLGVVDAGIRPLPVPGGADIVELRVRDARARAVVPPAPLAEWTQVPGVVAAGAVQQRGGTLLHPDLAARRVYGAAMHVSVFDLLQVAPAIGRLPRDADADGATIVLGARLYEELGGDPGLLGATVHLDDVAFTVIGIMPDPFGFPENESFWTVLPDHESGQVVARLTPGANRRTTTAALAARVDAAMPAAGPNQAGAPHRVAALDWTLSRDGDGAETAVFAGLVALVVLLLLVCCANVGTLLLVRGTERANLLAVQSALGATRPQVVLQLLLESLLIAGGGGVLGLGAGFFMLRWMELKLSSHWGYYWMTMEVRPHVLAATVALVILSALLAGTAPALRATRLNLASLLVGQGRGRGDPRERRLGRWLVGAQVALSSIGLIAAVYLAAEFSALGRTTERLPLESVAVARLLPPAGTYEDEASRSSLLERLRAELQRMPGVHALSISSDAPGGPGPVAALHVPGMDQEAQSRRIGWVAADEELQALYGLRMLAGQPLSAGTGTGVLVTRGVAERYYGGAAVGQRLRLAGVHADDQWAEIVGVVEDWFPDTRGVPGERVIVPLRDAWPQALYVSVAASDPQQVVGHVRAAVRRVDERIPVDDLQTLQARMDWFLRMMKVIAAFGVLGGVGSGVVAAIGLYGVMAFQVRARRREIGVRMAVGAASGRIALEVLQESVLRVAPGLVAGIGSALVVVPLLASVLPGGASAVALTRFVGISLFAAATLLVIGAIAAVEPALRAARLDPQEVLRAD